MNIFKRDLQKNDWKRTEDWKNKRADLKVG